MIPVIFIHFGECAYAPTILAHARRMGNEVFLLGETELLASRGAFNFGAHYKHLSSNHYAFELACIERWFVLRDWMNANRIPDCLYCDTDVLLFANAESEWHGDPYYAACDFTLSLGTSGHTSFWKRDALDAFCEFVYRTYRLLDATFDELARIYTEMRAQNLPGGVSDMLLLKMFREAHPHYKCGEMSTVRNGTVWDHNINASDGFRMEGGRKTIQFANGTPYGFHGGTGGIIAFKSLHLQGQAKQFIGQYVLDAERMPQ